MAGSETYGRPSSRNRLRFSSLGASPRAVNGRKPSSASSSASSRRISRLERLADQRRAGAQHGDLDALQVRVVQQPLLGRRALPPQPAALADGKRRAQLGFDQPGQREIEVVAAQQQVLAHGGAGEVDQVALARDADQAEIAGAAAHVADQHDLAVEELLARLRQVVRDPGIERRGRLFEQRQLLEAGIARGHHGQLARLFVERSRHGEDDVLLGQRRALARGPTPRGTWR